MVKPLVKVTNTVYPSLAAFYKKLLERDTKVLSYDGHEIHTEEVIYTMVDGKIHTEDKNESK